MISHPINPRKIKYSDMEQREEEEEDDNDDNNNNNNNENIEHSYINQMTKKVKYDRFYLSGSSSGSSRNVSNSTISNKRNIHDMMMMSSTMTNNNNNYDDSNDDSDQVMKKLCHIDLSTSSSSSLSSSSLSSRSSSTSGISERKFGNYDISTLSSLLPTSKNHPFPLQHINLFLRNLHEEKIHRHNYDQRQTSNLSIEKSTSNTFARTQPYYQQPHHIQSYRNHSHNINSSFEQEYDLQHDPQYQSRLEHHRLSYHSRVNRSSIPLSSSEEGENHSFLYHPYHYGGHHDNHNSQNDDSMT